MGYNSIKRNKLVYMRKIETIIVGLPVRNEEKSLYNNLKSIRNAILTSNEMDIRLIICINGCTDSSEVIAKKFKKNYPDIGCEIIKSNEGVVNAQRKIVKFYKADAYVFSDSDSIIDKHSIKLLLQALRLDPNLFVAYAKTKSLYDQKNKSFFYKIGILYDSQKLLTKRYYFHGRLFATKEWFMPADTDVLKRAKYNKKNSVLLKYYKNGILLAADDILMSSYFMHKYGLKSIKQIDDAVCYSWSVGSLKDWFNTYRRRNIEMEKMYRWFPEYNYLKPYLNRRTDWKKWLGAKIGDKILWTIFFLMRGAFVILFSSELFLINLYFYQPRKQWHITTTTKKSLYE